MFQASTHSASESVLVEAGCSQKASRTRPRRESAATTERPYRRDFTCQLIGRYFRKSKRHIRWTYFSTTSNNTLDAIASRKVEKERIELIWSLKSGKTSVFCNGSDISNLYRQEVEGEVMNIGWESASGRRIHLVAHAERPEDGQYQYNLFIDGVSFFDLQYFDENEFVLPEELGYEVVERWPLVEQQGADLPYLSIDDVSDLGCSVTGAPEAVKSESAAAGAGNIDYRLSLIGINTGPKAVEIVDELIESDCFTPLINEIRSQITSYLPQTEETVSKAITNALFADSVDSTGSSDSSSSDSTEHDPGQIQADAIREAFDWVHNNVEYDPRPDALDMALVHMQKQIESAFVNIRHNVFDSSQACRMLLNIASVLGLKFAQPIPHDTLVLDGLSSTTEVVDIYNALGVFGEIQDVKIAKGYGFGVVRLKDEKVAAQIQSEADHLIICEAQPHVIVLSDTVHEGLTLKRPRSLDSSREDSPEVILDSSALDYYEPKTCSLGGDTEVSTTSTDIHDIDLSGCNTSPDTVTRMVEPSYMTGFKPERAPVYNTYLD